MVEGKRRGEKRKKCRGDEVSSWWRGGCVLGAR